MTTAQVVETSVTVNNNSRIQDYVHPDDQTQPTFERIIYKKFSGENDGIIKKVKLAVVQPKLTFLQTVT